MKYIKKFEHNIPNMSDYEEDLFDEIHFGYYNQVVDLIKNKKVNINCQDDNNWSPLIKAVIANRLKIAKFLIKNGANINYICRTGKTAIVMAAESNLHDMIDLLIEAGADLYVKDNYGLDFFYYLTEDYLEKVIEKYPIECEKYIMERQLKKYNL